MTISIDRRIRDITDRLRDAAAELGRIAEVTGATAPPETAGQGLTLVAQAAALLRHRQLRKRVLGYADRDLCRR